jgi:hypothetical protein
LALYNLIKPLPPPNQPTCFFWFEKFLTWQFFLEKNGNNNENSKKDVKNKKITKFLKKNLEKKKVTPNE